MKKYLSIMNFKGRYDRKQFAIAYFVTFLLLFVMTLGLTQIHPYIKNPLITNYIIPIPIFAVIIANLSTIAKRLHDLNYSGTWLIFIFGLQLSFKNYPPINYTLSAIIVLYLCLKKGNEGENKYG